VLIVVSQLESMWGVQTERGGQTYSLRLSLWTLSFITARRYASAVLAVVVCLSLLPSVHLSVSQTPVLCQNG